MSLTKREFADVLFPESPDPDEQAWLDYCLWSEESGRDARFDICAICDVEVPDEALGICDFCRAMETWQRDHEEPRLTDPMTLDARERCASCGTSPAYPWSGMCGPCSVKDGERQDRETERAWREQERRDGR